MMPSRMKQRLFSIFLIIAIAFTWVLLDATPALAQDQAQSTIPTVK